MVELSYLSGCDTANGPGAVGRIPVVRGYAGENFLLRVWGLQGVLCHTVFGAGCVQGCLRRQLLPLEGSRWLGCRAVGGTFLLRVPWSGSAKVPLNYIIRISPFFFVSSYQLDIFPTNSVP